MFAGIARVLSVIYTTPRCTARDDARPRLMSHYSNQSKPGIRSFCKMANLKVFIFWQYHHFKEHQPFATKGQSRFYPRIWPLKQIFSITER